MTSELRPASDVWSAACGAYEDAAAVLADLPMRDIVVAGDEAAAAVIEADREAVRAEQAAELAKFKALAETLAGALGEAVTWNSHDDEGVPAVWLDQADVALREYKGKTHVAVAQYKEARDV